MKALRGWKEERMEEERENTSKEGERAVLVTNVGHQEFVQTLSHV